MSEESFVIGKLLSIFFQNSQNFYKVALIEIEETNCLDDLEEVVITGHLGDLHPDTSYRFYGDIVNHPKYGKQFQVKNYQQNQPTGEKGLVLYFSGNRFPGIGLMTAKKIVKALGETAIDQIIASPDALEKVEGLSQAKAKMIRETILANAGDEKILFDLTSLGFTPLLAQKILMTYRERALELVKDNPYLVLEDLNDVSFQTVDAIATSLEIGPDDLKRIKGAVFVTVRNLSYQLAHTCLEPNWVLDGALKLLEGTRSYLIDPDILVEGLNETIRDGKVISLDEGLALASLYYAEIGIASAMKRKVLSKTTQAIKPQVLNQALDKVQAQLGIHYDPSQLQALRAIIQEPVLCLTGGPGTGKTTLIQGAILLYKELYAASLKKKALEGQTSSLLLAAPTGRAAKRMAEVTGQPASTLHRLLGLGAEGEVQGDQIKDLEGDFLIVDEMSMVDTFLMNHLMKAMHSGIKCLFVGDRNQLPSVGPGQVFQDLLDSGLVPVIELQTIHRQKDASTIIQLAHTINQGHLPQDFPQKQRDRSFLPCSSHQIATVIQQVVQMALKKGYSKRDIQVLAPMYKGDAGIHKLNEVLQEILNPKINDRTREIVHFENRYRVGDRVLQRVNVPEKGIFNGDFGEISAISYAKENQDQVDKIFVTYEDIEVEYLPGEWNQITHAYACSIHKSQGSEFRMVILPMVPAYGRMLRRNLLYTAVTRSKEVLILCGDYQSFSRAAQQKGEERRTRLKTLLNPYSQVLTQDLEEDQEAQDLEPGLDKEPPALVSGGQSQDPQASLQTESENQHSSSLAIEETLEERSKSASKKTGEEEFACHIQATSQAQDDKRNLIPMEASPAGQGPWILTPQMVADQSIDPLIGLAGKTPYDFREEAYL